MSEQYKPSLEPVAVIVSDYAICWAGSGPIAPIIERTGVKVGSKLVSMEQVQDYIDRERKLIQHTAPTHPSPEEIGNAALEEAAQVCESRAGDCRHAHEREADDCADAIRSLKSQPAQPNDSQELDDNMRSFIEGMSVSIDVSTGAHDVDHRLFGTVSEVMDSGSDKHGVILLVHDQKPNFKPSDSQAEPSDTNTLEWLMFDHELVCEMTDGTFEFIGRDNSKYYGNSPRSAIKAAMKAEREGS